MDRKEKQQEVFLKLVNKQLLPHGKTYQDVKSDPQWYLRYSTTTEAEREFMNWGVEVLCEELGITKKLAEKEMSWFILQYGLITKPSAVKGTEAVTEKAKAKN